MNQSLQPLQQAVRQANWFRRGADLALACAVLAGAFCLQGYTLTHPQQLARHLAPIQAQVQLATKNSSQPLVQGQGTQLAEDAIWPAVSSWLLESKPGAGQCLVFAIRTQAVDAAPSAPAYQWRCTAFPSTRKARPNNWVQASTDKPPVFGLTPPQYEPDSHNTDRTEPTKTPLETQEAADSPPTPAPTASGWIEFRNKKFKLQENGHWK